MNCLAQIIAFVALIFFVLSMQMKNKKKFILFQLISNLLYGVSYLFLFVPLAFMMCLISIIRSLLLYFSNDKPSKKYLYALIIMNIFFGIILYNDLLSLIPIIITLVYTISTWQDNMKVISILFIVAAVFWIYYNYIVGAYVAIVGNFFEILSGVISIIRFQYNKKTLNFKR